MVGLHIVYGKLHIFLVEQDKSRGNHGSEEEGQMSSRTQPQLVSSGSGYVEKYVF